MWHKPLSKDIKQGAVDPGLKVHGVKNLRVIDASVFPLIPDCRIQNVVYMVAEKARIILTSSPCMYRFVTDNWVQRADAIRADHPNLYR